jgi:hypothetical protein
MILYIKKAFTLTEIIVATFISTIILGLIFTFLWDVLDNVSKAEWDSKIITSIYDFNSKLDNYRDIYSTGWIFIDKNIWIWNDIFLMEDVDWNWGVLFWSVDASSKKLINDASKYSNKILWFRLLSSSEITTIKGDNSLVYGLLFRNENLFYDLIVKDLQLTWYNSNTIFNIYLSLNSFYTSWLDWTEWLKLDKNNLTEFNINF